MENKNKYSSCKMVIKHIYLHIFCADFAIFVHILCAYFATFICMFFTALVIIFSSLCISGDISWQKAVSQNTDHATMNGTVTVLDLYVVELPFKVTRSVLTFPSSTSLTLSQNWSMQAVNPSKSGMMNWWRRAREINTMLSIMRLHGIEKPMFSFRVKNRYR